MMNFILAGSLVVLSQAQFALNGGPECENYVQDDGTFTGYLKPVGSCWYDNSDQTEIGDYSWSYSQPKIFMCEEINGELYAVEYEVGANCNAQARKVPTNRTFACPGGANSTCSCTIGGNADNCNLYEKTDYDWKWGRGLRIVCDKEKFETTRYVVDMCIRNDDYSGVDGYSRAYECATNNYGIAYGSSSFNSYCSTGSPTQSPTPSPTQVVVEGQSTTTEDGSLFCVESTCAGFDGPRADRGNTFNVVVAAVTVAINAFIFS